MCVVTFLNTAEHKTPEFLVKNFMKKRHRPSFGWKRVSGLSVKCCSLFSVLIKNIFSWFSAVNAKFVLSWVWRELAFKNDFVSYWKRRKFLFHQYSNSSSSALVFNEISMFQVNSRNLAFEMHLFKKWFSKKQICDFGCNAKNNELTWTIFIRWKTSYRLTFVESEIQVDSQLLTFLMFHNDIDYKLWMFVQSQCNLEI